jgi:diguanylate cyclase (GGDEF)-like protein
MNTDDKAPGNSETALKRMERRDWWLWGIAIAFLLLLTFAIYSFMVLQPPIPGRPWMDARNAVRGLLALILVFSAFAAYRQVILARLRSQLATQAKLVGALQTRAELFQKLAILDPLTGLYNRRFALQYLPGEMARAARHNYRLTVLLIDLNGLKRINDQYGHSAGDLTLREFAGALRKAMRSSDIAARIGGDEFLAILPECDGASWPRMLARISHVEATYRGEKIPIHFAAGWAEYVVGESVDEILERADRHLYEDKRTGAVERQASAAREQLRQAAKFTTMGQITSGVAHEFNNLLTVIKGYAELLLSQLTESAEMHHEVTEIHRASERAASLTGHLLAFSRKQAFEPRLLDVNRLVASTEMMLRRVLGDRVKLKFEPAEDLYPVKADASQMEQLIMNLIAHSRDLMPQGGSVFLQTGNFEMDAAFCAVHPGSRPGRYVFLRARETAPGTESQAPEPAAQTFLLPGQISSLGLATVYGIVKQNDGYLLVESFNQAPAPLPAAAPGPGAPGESAQPEAGNCAITTITAFLRSAAQQAPAEPVRPAEPPAPERRARKGASVLVVESLESLQQFLCDFLRNQGCEVLPAASGEDAIRLSAESSARIHLIIADMILPGMSGMELVDCIRAQRPSIKALYITGYPEDAALHQDLLQGDAEFLTAPFSPQQFSEKLHRLLAESA